MKHHPFQRLEAPSYTGSLFLHVVGLISFAYSFKFLVSWQTPITDSYGWHFQFLTILGLTATTVAFALGLLADILQSPQLFALKNAISTVATPLECLVSALYWGLRQIDPELIVPPEFVIPMDVDLSFHLAPAVFLLLDHLLYSPPYQTSSGAMVVYATGVGFSYWYWVEVCYKANGWYVYPLFGLLSTAQRVGLFVFSSVLVTVFFASIKKTHGALNGSVVRVDTRSTTSKKKRN